MGELRALRWRDVDFAARVVRVRASYADGVTTTANRQGLVGAARRCGRRVARPARQRPRLTRRRRPTAVDLDPVGGGFVAATAPASLASSLDRSAVTGAESLARSARGRGSNPVAHLPGSRASAIQPGHHRIASVPFTLRNLKEDLEDVGSRFDGAPDLEFRLATEALELERSGLGYQRVPPGYRFPYGHTHRTQEEVYVVLRGSGRMKLDDEIVELKEWDAVRIPPGTWRGYEAGPEGLEILVIGAPSLGEARREDVEGRRDWWAD